MQALSVDVVCSNTFEKWAIDEEFYTHKAQEIFLYFLQNPEIFDNSCLNRKDYDTVSFDFTFCDSKTTHELNKTYRGKDYPADIITFSIFADTPKSEQFVLDGCISLGSSIIALDKVTEASQNKGTPKEFELMFLISHGIMHLLGFDHQTEEDYNFVVSWQNKALEAVGYDKI